MEGAPKTEWSKAQEITFSVDLVDAARKQLQFLAAVDSTGCLYNGPALERAIYRYKNCWLPLLAKHVESSEMEGPLVVPLDCEWIWHCHRLNPLQYKRDCEEIYGRILGTLNVMSTFEGPCSKQTESIWNKVYVTEPYNLDLANVESPVSGDNEANNAKTQKSIDYDFVAAAKRQSDFFSKVSNEISGTDVDNFLKEAVARYKAFLHMIKTVRERNIKVHCVPTRDMDLIWHTHQLYPMAYCKDLMATLGTILDHNDRDIGTTEGGKMAEVGLSRSQQVWEETFGNTYFMGSGAENKGMEHSKARCWCLVAGEEGSKASTKQAARCWCLVAGEEGSKVSTKEAARCWCLVAGEEGSKASTKQAARCWCLVAGEEGSKVSTKEAARCWCLVAGEEGTVVSAKKEAARCWCLVAGEEGTKTCTKQEAARCWCLVADEEGAKTSTKQEAARCWCLVAGEEGTKTSTKQEAARCGEEGSKACAKEAARCWCLVASEGSLTAEGITAQ